MIRFENALYRSGTFQLALDFEISAGTIVTVLGPSGAGKSTLLSVIAGFEPLHQGRLFLGGEGSEDLRPAMRPVSIVFQDNNSFAHLTARNNVGLGLRPDLRLSGEQWHSVDQALERVGIAALAQRMPGNMSGGERQRIAIARALVRRKPILLLDEAFAALGPGLRREMIMLVSALQQEHGLTLVMVTHQPEDAYLLDSQILFIDQGVARGPMARARFFAQKHDAAISDYLGAQLASPARTATAAAAAARKSTPTRA